MSAKPGSVPRWANAGGAITVPPSGKQDVGWVAGEAPPAEYFNWLHNLAYQWTLWLSDGDVSFATLAMSGITTLTGLLNANGGITVPTGKAVAFNGTTTLTTGSGLVSLGGALTAAGLITGSAGVTVPTGQALTVAGTGTVTVGTGLVSLGGALTVTGLVTANAGASVPTGQNITLVGTADLKHGSREIGIAAAAFQMFSTATTSTFVPVTLTAKTFYAWRFGTGGNGNFCATIPLRTGDRIISMVVTELCVGGAAGSGGTWNLYSESFAVGQTSRFSASTALVPTNTLTSFSSGTINYTIAAGEAMYVYVANNDTANTCYMANVQITYDHP